MGDPELAYLYQQKHVSLLTNPDVVKTNRYANRQPCSTGLVMDTLFSDSQRLVAIVYFTENHC